MSQPLVYKYETEVRTLDKLKLFYVEIPLEALEFFSKPDTKNLYNQRLIISINQCEPWHGGVVSLGNQTGYITVKGKILKDLHVRADDPVQVVLTEDNSEYGMEFPEEFREVLAQDPEAENRFLALPMGKRRYIIYHIAQVKSSTKKIERAWMLMNNLKKLPKGNEEFRRILGKE